MSQTLPTFAPFNGWNETRHGAACRFHVELPDKTHLIVSGNTMTEMEEQFHEFSKRYHRPTTARLTHVLLENRPTCIVALSINEIVDLCSGSRAGHVILQPRILHPATDKKKSDSQSLFRLWDEPASTSQEYIFIAQTESIDFALKGKTMGEMEAQFNTMLTMYTYTGPYLDLVRLVDEKLTCIVTLSIQEIVWFWQSTVLWPPIPRLQAVEPFQPFHDRDIKAEPE